MNKQHRLIVQANSIMIKPRSNKKHIIQTKNDTNAYISKPNNAKALNTTSKSTVLIFVCPVRDKFQKENKNKNSQG